MYKSYSGYLLVYLMLILAWGVKLAALNSFKVGDIEGMFYVVLLTALFLIWPFTSRDIFSVSESVKIAEKNGCIGLK